MKTTFIRNLYICLLFLLFFTVRSSAEEIMAFLVQDSFWESTVQDSGLLFEDTFDGTDLDDSKWERCPEWDRQGELNVWDDAMSYLDGHGNLVLRAEWCTDDGKIHSGAVRTNGRFSETFAYYEASIRFPTSPGIWGAFWMLAGNAAADDGTAAEGVEIDIIESISAQYGCCNSALHWGGYGINHQVTSRMYDESGIYDGQFHTFGLWRTPEAYFFYIDREEVWRVLPEECEVCPEPGYLKLSVEGAYWAGAGSQESIAALPAEMIVADVRVYQSKPF